MTGILMAIAIPSFLGGWLLRHTWHRHDYRRRAVNLILTFFILWGACALLNHLLSSTR